MGLTFRERVTLEIWGSYMKQRLKRFPAMVTPLKISRDEFRVDSSGNAVKVLLSPIPIVDGESEKDIVDHWREASRLRRMKSVFIQAARR